MKIKAICTWGDGPDVLLALKGQRMMLHEDPFDLDKGTHGFVTDGSLDLTSKEALILAQQLYNAAMLCIEIENTYKEYCENDRSNKC